MAGSGARRLGAVVRDRGRRATGTDGAGQVALVTGGSRGLGLILARQLAETGHRLAICGRDGAALDRARLDLERRGADVLAVTCDIADRRAAEDFADAALSRFGTVDLLVNNAGLIQVGPLATMTVADFEDAMGVMFWGTLYPTLAVLPHMLSRRAGRIVNITSVGGKISAPHLLPYNCAKFAAVGLSEGLHAELAGTGVRVTTVVPGLMRTGSPLNAYFKGRSGAEFSWFLLGDSLPLLSMDAERAARQILTASRRGRPEVILTLPAKVGARVHGLLPGTTLRVLAGVGRLLPTAPDGTAARRGDDVTAARRGEDVREGLHSRLLEMASGLSLAAARRFHQLPSPTPRTASDE